MVGELFCVIDVIAVLVGFHQKQIHRFWR